MPAFTIATWFDMAIAIHRRRPSAARHAAVDRHLRAFPIDEIEVELDIALMDRAVGLLKGPPHHFHTLFARPHRGARGAAPQTPIVVALSNRVMRLRAAGVGGNHAPADRSEGSRSREDKGGLFSG